MEGEENRASFYYRDTIRRIFAKNVQRTFFPKPISKTCSYQPTHTIPLHAYGVFGKEAKSELKGAGKI